MASQALTHAASGSLGTAVSTAILYPLDLATTRLKAQHQQPSGSDRHDGVLSVLKDVVSRDEFSALYRGLGPDVAKSVIDSFLFFGFYSYLRPRDRKPRILEELYLGAMAGACARVVTTPVSNVVTLKQASDTGDEGVWQTLREIRRRSGIWGLWSGYSATLVLTLNPSITFLVNRRLAKRVLPALEEEDIPVAWASFILAATSKATATALTYPFQTGKTRLQMASKEGDSKTADLNPSQPKSARAGLRAILQNLIDLLDKTIFGVVIRILQQEGLQSLYTGLRGELLKSFLSHGTTMLMKGFMHRLIIWLWVARKSHMRLARSQAKS